MFVGCFLKSLGKVLFLVGPAVFNDFIWEFLINIEIGVNLQKVTEYNFAFKLVFVEELSVGDKSGRIDKCFEDVVHEWDNSGDLSPWEEGFWTPGWECTHEFEIGHGLIESGWDDHGELFLIFFIFFTELSVFLFLLELFVLGVVGVGLIKTVSGVGHDHIEEFFKDGELKVFGEIGAVYLVVPEGGEDFVDIESVLELGVELMWGASDSNIAVEANESIGEILVCKLISTKSLTHNTSLSLLQEVEDEFNKVTSHIRVGGDFLLTE